MNHRNKNNHLGRKRGHRKSLLSNMASSLIKKKRIFTTLAKAKALRKYIEPIITKSKIDTTHSKRNIFSYLKDKTAVSELFKDIFQKIRERPGGYTRIIKTGFRFGDQASFSLIELVDFNEIYDSKKRKKSVRRSRKKIKRVNNE
ncbi:50S ribosomal protein L17 [Blattabacterium cuenoti]|nr:50S ribosomal protein L17 [Blattabacterium cuenoti]